MQSNNQNQVDKITQRKQKIGIFGNQHAQMKQEQLATTDTFSLPVKQDSLNPNLKNIKLNIKEVRNKLFKCVTFLFAFL